MRRGQFEQLPFLRDVRDGPRSGSEGSGPRFGSNTARDREYPNCELWHRYVADSGANDDAPSSTAQAGRE
jgi:hypothetical protein